MARIFTFEFECGKCGMTYPTKHGLSVHQGRWYKSRRTAKKPPSRKGTVADELIQRLKVDKVQEKYEKIKIGEEKLDNVFTFVYLEAKVPADGDPAIPVKHRCDIVWGRFGE